VGIGHNAYACTTGYCKLSSVQFQGLNEVPTINHQSSPVGINTTMHRSRPLGPHLGQGHKPDQAQQPDQSQDGQPVGGLVCLSTAQQNTEVHKRNGRHDVDEEATIPATSFTYEKSKLERDEWIQSGDCRALQIGKPVGIVKAAVCQTGRTQGSKTSPLAPVQACKLLHVPCHRRVATWSSPSMRSDGWVSLFSPRVVLGNFKAVSDLNFLVVILEHSTPVKRHNQVDGIDDACSCEPHYGQTCA
jgi:hypothetical protein